MVQRDQLIALIAAEYDAERHGRGRVKVDGWPDEEDRTGKAVDFLGHDDVLEIVVEHTRIESFPDQIDDRHATRAMFPKLGPQIPGRRDAGRFVLWVTPGALRAVPFDRRPSVARAITAWVADNLDRVAWEQTLYGQHHDVPFRWALSCWLPDEIVFRGPYASVVPIRHTSPDDLEQRRAHRMGQVIRDKLPKLAAAGAGRRRTILVLEDKDQTASGPLLVSRAMRCRVADNRLPDVIYLFYDGGADPLLCVVYEVGTWAHDSPDFRWLSLPVHRIAELRDLPTTWA